MPRFQPRFISFAGGIDEPFLVNTLPPPRLNVFTPPKGVSDMDAHANEYAGAVAGMQDTYGTGDFVSGETGGRRWSGRVEWQEGEWLSVNVDGAWVRVPVKDITH
jgi:hypothetical protein